MVMALERLIAVAELAFRAAKAVKALQSSGNGPAAAVLQAECDRACASIVAAAKRRRTSSHRARNRVRVSGRFT